MGVVLEEGMPAPAQLTVARMTSLPFVVVGVRRGEVDPGWFDLCDVVADEGDPALERIWENLEARPVACTALALLLRAQPRRSPDDGLVAESATYSVLQAGPEFASWRAAHPPRTAPDAAGPRVAGRTRRRGARGDPDPFRTIERPRRPDARRAQRGPGAGRGSTPTWPGSSCAARDGRFVPAGDLDEFGSRADPATAHLVRLQRSVGRALARLGKPVAAYVHGASFGSGVELAAFAGTVLAAPDTRIALPEVGLGLVPGAGGTASLPARIGRLRTAWLAFSGGTIDAATARRWGLVDEVVPDGVSVPR